MPLFVTHTSGVYGLREKVVAPHLLIGTLLLSLGRSTLSPINDFYGIQGEQMPYRLDLLTAAI